MYTCFAICSLFWFFLLVCALFIDSPSGGFSDWRIGLLSALFLVLTPRFFAESFYNSKDIVFMAVFAVGMNTTISFVLHRALTRPLYTH